MKRVLICDTQPVAVEGMRWLIENSDDLRFAGSVATLEMAYHILNPPPAVESEAGASGVFGTEAPAVKTAAIELMIAGEPAVQESATGKPFLPADEQAPVRIQAGIEASAEEAEPGLIPAPAVTGPIDAVIIDTGFGMMAVMDFLQRLTATSHPTPIVVWGASISEPEALRLLKAGARGMLRRTSEPDLLLTCLRAVTSNGTWMEDGIFGSSEKLFNSGRSHLTHRESEVVVLVEQGLRNRDIARVLGIRTGTVKIHLKHIYEKTGVRGRYGLAFTGLREKGSISLPRQLTA